MSKGVPLTSCFAQGRVFLTLLLALLFAGFLHGGVGQHLLHQPAVCPGEPLGGRAARDPGCDEPDPDSHAHLRETPEEGEMSPDPSHSPCGRALWAKGSQVRVFLFLSLQQIAPTLEFTLAHVPSD